jgi:hypothetical protein
MPGFVLRNTVSLLGSLLKEQMSLTIDFVHLEDIVIQPQVFGEPRGFLMVRRAGYMKGKGFDGECAC